MIWLAEKVLALVRPASSRPIESTRDELVHERVVRRQLHRRTTRLALILDDYRRSDGALRR